MANPPNIIDITQMLKVGYLHTLGTSEVSYFSASSNYGYSINNLTYHNWSSGDVTVTVKLQAGSGTNYYLANAMTIPSKSSLILASKENPLYMMNSSNSSYAEGLSALASSASAIDQHLHFEYWYDPN